MCVRDTQRISQFDDVSKYQSREMASPIQFFQARQTQEMDEDHRLYSYGHAPLRFRPFKAPDSIQFNKSEQIIEKIRRLVPGIMIYEHAQCFGAEYNDKIEIAAVHAKEFFTAVQRVQEENPHSFIPLRLFETTLQALVANKYVTQAEADTYKATIRARLTFDDYTSEADNGDLRKALSLALYYRDHDEGPERALKWLSVAKRELKEGALNDYIDLADFFAKIDCLNHWGIFGEGRKELLEFACRAPSITSLSYDRKPDAKATANIARFLATSPSICKVFFYEKIPDETVATFMAAIKSNPQAKVTTFWVARGS